jgi:tRNA dimethylallyltransferase
MSSTDYPAIAVVGPTASGKSLLVSLLAGRFNGEVLSCDALQVYRCMDIGTAKPTPAERESVPYHMLDLRHPDENFSAGDYQRLAREALRGIRQRGRVPFVAGGTGFYLRALIDGLFEGPGRSEALRLRLQGILQRKGAPYLHRRLQRIDPQTAGRIASTDASRTVRAYEIYLLTGKTMEWWQQQARDSLKGFRWLKLGISWPREKLYQRINLRVEEMFQQGLVEEVRRLVEKYPKDCHAFTAIGYRQIIEYLDGALSLDQAIHDTQQATRNYAKRQLTWFRADGGVTWLQTSEDIEATAAEASRLIRTFLS